MSWDDSGVLQPTFHGTGDQLTFLTPLPSRNGMPAGLFSASLKLVPGQDGRGRPLALEFQPVGGANAPSTAGGHAPSALDDVTQLAVRYYGMPERAAEPKWLDDWQEQKPCPASSPWMSNSRPAIRAPGRRSRRN